METLARQDLTTFYLVLGLLVAAVMVGGLVLLALRRRLLRPEPPRHVSLLEELRRMQSSGKMTADEFDRARRALARSAAGMPAASGKATPAREASGSVPLVERPGHISKPPSGGELGA